MLLCFFFFFSSRRRHTRCGRDWSSDVCSSDLSAAEACGIFAARCNSIGRNGFGRGEIGRASCRERVEISVVAVSLKKKKNNKLIYFTRQRYTAELDYPIHI